MIVCPARSGATCRGSAGATSAGTSCSPASRAGARPSDRRRAPADARVHQRDHRPAEGRRPRRTAGSSSRSPQEVAYQLDVQRRRAAVLGHRHGLDHGPVGDRRRAALGATVFLYEGAPDYPAPDRLWAMVERHASRMLGISPTLIRALMPPGDEHVRAHDLSALRILGSTGEPWNPEPVALVLRARSAAARCPIINISGGTEVGGGFLVAALRSPRSSRARSAARRPAWRSTWFDDDGKPVRGRGRRAGLHEAVARHDARASGATPSATSRPTGAAGPDVWVHGDWATVDADGFWFLHGRQRRHDERRRQAARAGRGRVGPGRPPGRRRVGRGRHPRRGEGRGRRGASW